MPDVKGAGGLYGAHNAAGARPFGLDENPPVSGLGNRDVNFDAVGRPDDGKPESGSDSYQGIPGDGIVPG